MSKDLNMLPLINEKTYDLSKQKNVFTFKVPLSANKLTVASALKAQFDVESVSVNLATIKGKTKRTMSLSGSRSVNSRGKRPDFKKAYVKLKKGQSLPFFESIDEAEEQRESKQEKFDQVAKKQADKESKVVTKDATTKRRFLRTKKPEGK